MEETIKDQFQSVLSQLEKAYQQMKQAQASFEELAKVQFLQEIVKEQVQNENSDHSVR